MPQTFVALQCAFCEAYQVTLDKASKKFSCAICCQKQSFKKIHAISNAAKDCRRVVQELNELRGARDRQLGSEETAAALEHAAAAAAAGCPASDAAQQQNLGWEEFAEQDDDAGNDDDDWLAGTGEFVTTLPDCSSTRGRGEGKRCGKMADADDDAPYKQPRYGQGRGKQQQQAYHGATAPGSGSGLGVSRPPAQLQRVPQQHPNHQQSRQPPLQPQQQQQRPWQPQQQQQAAPACQQQNSSQPQQQQQQGLGHWSRQAAPDLCAPVGKAHISGAGSCGAALPQSQPAQHTGWGAIGNPQQSQQQHPQQQQQQQQQLRLKPPLGSNMATVKQRQQQQGGPRGYSSTQQQQQQQQLPSKGAGNLLMVQPPAATAAAGGGGAWGAFVDDEGPGACSSDEAECIFDGQSVCCLGFTGPEGFGAQGTAAAPGHHGSTAASRWS